MKGFSIPSNKGKRNFSSSSSSSAFSGNVGKGSAPGMVVATAPKQRTQQARDYFDDDEEESASSFQSTTAGGGDDDYDPLDAFM
jgi:hypothetical protein